MKKLGFIVCATLFVTSGAWAKTTSRAHKKHQAKHKKKTQQKQAKKVTQSKAVPTAEVRAPASEVDSTELQVHSEKTGFEALVRQQDELSRRPAGFNGNARVISLRRELGLTRSEADSAPQDIVLNAGYKEGISEGMVMQVARKVPILDPYKDNQQSEMSIQFASIRVVHVEEEIAVARVEKVDPIRSGVGIGVRGVLVGDYVGTVIK